MDKYMLTQRCNIKSTKSATNINPLQTLNADIKTVPISDGKRTSTKHQEMKSSPQRGTHEHIKSGSNTHQHIQSGSNQANIKSGPIRQTSTHQHIKSGPPSAMRADQPVAHQTFNGPYVSSMRIQTLKHIMHQRHLLTFT